MVKKNSEKERQQIFLMLGEIIACFSVKENASSEKEKRITEERVLLLECTLD